MKKTLIIFIMMLVATSLSAQTRLTLEDAISIALQRNTSLIQAKNNLEYTESSLKRAYGNLLPDLGISGSWSWERTEDEGGYQVDPSLGQLVLLPASKTDTRRYSVGVGGSWTLFDGLANVSAISQAGNNLDAAEFSLAKLKQDIVLQTTELYYAILNAKAVLNVRNENVKYNEKFLETVIERNKLGSVPIADVYAQQYQSGNAELLQIQAENQYETAKSNLLNYLALDVLEEHEFVDPFERAQIDTDEYVKEFQDVSTMVATALSSRNDYKSQLLMVESAGSGVTIARGGLMPSLSGSYSYGTSAVTTEDLFNRKVWSVGLTLSLPIFSNWNTENQIEYAKVNELNEAENLTALERQIKIEVKQGYNDLVAGKKSLDVARKNVMAASENRKINYERYNLGSGTILDILQADRDYTEALRNKINVEFEFYRLRDRLNNYLGQLDYKKFE